MLYFLSPLQCSCSFFIQLHSGSGGLKFNFRVLTIKKRLILGTIITYGAVVATSMINFPTVAIELNANTQQETVQQENVENTVREYFRDIPILAEVARCESHFTHINPATNSVIRGRVNNRDVGVMQINEYYHSTTAKKMGLNLLNFKDNMEYARYLYEKEGTRPWNASKACWQKRHIAMR